jgi:citrate lyase subunit beta/citryl-CoA lyase
VAARVTPIDGVCLAVKDDEAFRLEASDAARLGFEGKLCIHPSQVPIANRIFTPTEEQIATAQRIVEARDAALASGKSVFSLDGRMVDAPLVAAQERLLARARRAGTLPELRAS